ncbi:one-helix protein [Klebsormidium nitens]|uniref:One-helix protein n=1 Tax=Klebsormidium nitens TaxID=105231 RepID=A0A0U9HJA6_KLENI|nr:one-helix protein [Klebsormidium nitens]|eukprot:GAQ81840.1 one-helix protein [Klebsormidium nitens]
MASACSLSVIDIRSAGISSWQTSSTGCAELVSKCTLAPVSLLTSKRSASRRFEVRNAAAEGSQTQTASASPPPAAAASKKPGVTIEFQRQKAKELVQYFEERKVEEQIRKERIFGWTRKNEIGNGRWVMFGIAVGLLTEYATGSDLIDQLKIIVSNLGILDLE